MQKNLKAVDANEYARRNHPAWGSEKAATLVHVGYLARTVSINQLAHGSGPFDLEVDFRCVLQAKKRRN